MPGVEILWLFVLLAAMQPVLKQKMLEAARRRLIGRIEKERGSRVILIVHRQETMSLLGFPIVRYIDVHDSEEVLRAIDMTDPELPIDLVLHTPGGLVLASTQIARAIHRRPGKVTVHVPHHALSGGTLIALAADEIALSPCAVLGPIDPQLGQWPAASILRVLEQKPPAEIDDRTFVLADQARKATAQVAREVRTLLADRMGEERARELADTLTRGTWTHDFPLTADDLEELGIEVEREVPRQVRTLMGLYPQPTRRHPSVEYVPERRGRRPPDGGDAVLPG